ncbi:MAG: cytochrome c1 [Betaproteobacteria bacterium]|nr:MAG: cytochrome c1 [Betaproteobacteria bacterium]
MKALLLLACLLGPAIACGASEEVRLYRANIDLRDAVSIQRGAKVFVNYCLNCHSASYMRYNRLTDLGLSERQISDNLIFSDAKIGETMTVAMREEDGKIWFGVAPPDLSVIARSRGADWLYSYLRGFYRDASAVTGWNNVVFPNVAMPHVFWKLQGIQRFHIVEGGHHAEAHSELVLETPGTMSVQAYDEMLRDLVAYLAYMAEPVSIKRVRVGIVVLLFLGLLIVMTWLLKREYWKDVH